MSNDGMARNRIVVAAAIGVIATVLAAGLSVAATPRFQVRCLSSHVAQVDPIVNPGGVSGHMHEFFGNVTTNADSTYNSMVAGGTTCSTPKDTAGYWTPTVHRADGSIVRAKSLLIYYRGEPGEATVPFPANLKVISDDVAFGAATNDRLRVRFPSCWDGLTTDSPDHRSHMAFEVKGNCPQSHPIRVPEIVEVFRYGGDISGFRLSSGGFDTAHADFWNTWDQATLEELTDACLNGGTQCPRIDG